jgi:hypothetical protein
MFETSSTTVSFTYLPFCLVSLSVTRDKPVLKQKNLLKFNFLSGTQFVALNTTNHIWARFKNCGKWLLISSCLSVSVRLSPLAWYKSVPIRRIFAEFYISEFYISEFCISEFYFQNFIFQNFIFKNFVFQNFVFQNFIFQNFVFQNFIFQNFIFQNFVFQNFVFQNFVFQNFVFQNFIFQNFIFQNFTKICLENSRVVNPHPANVENTVSS